MIALRSHSREMTMVGSTLAACVLSLGLVQSVSADLVIRDVNVTLNASNLDTYNLDLNRDGTTDFKFTAATSLTRPCPSGSTP